MAVAVLAVVFVAGLVLPELSIPFLPLFSSDANLQRYPVLSLVNLVEVANEALLCLPALLLLAAMAFFGGRRKSDHLSRLLGWLVSVRLLTC